MAMAMGMGVGVVVAAALAAAGPAAMSAAAEASRLRSRSSTWGRGTRRTGRERRLFTPPAVSRSSTWDAARAPWPWRPPLRSAAALS